MSWCRPDEPPGLAGPDTLQNIHEPLVLFGYLAAVTERVERATGVVSPAAAPDRAGGQQAAEIDVLSGARLRLGVGLGWV